MSSVLYKKINGKLVKVAREDRLGALYPGFYLVSVTPGCRSRTKILNPKYAEFAAAAKICLDGMVAKMDEVDRAKPSNTKRVTPKIALAWRKLTDLMGTEMCLYHGSRYDIARAGIDAVEKYVLENKNV